MSINMKYILIMFAVTQATRIIPILLVRKKINNKFIISFFYYVPYVTLSIMIFPAIINAPEHSEAGVVAFIVGLIASWYKDNMILVSILCCVAVFITEFIIGVI